ncbi:hypothetical protein HMPREF0663_12112 [Hoylesella oralis ATCC 33269]|uniref:Uncharacterized protein n=1 Tax=Hoylesella oralis ATCC 33269 TaxID=873533 RepID=E7RS44_9BACT|nr:hypothetical protein HMPREF0663_12112 [Hoylesella oralis ATCC 33269]
MNFMLWQGFFHALYEINIFTYTSLDNVFSVIISHIEAQPIHINMMI